MKVARLFVLALFISLLLVAPVAYAAPDAPGHTGTMLSAAQSQDGRDLI